jgi:hypothetical protein
MGPMPAAPLPARGAVPALYPTAPFRLSASRKGLFVERDELADCARESRVAGRSEWIAASYVLEARDKDRKAKGIEPRLGKGKIVGQRRQGPVLLSGHGANFRQYFFS